MTKIRGQRDSEENWKNKCNVDMYLAKPKHTTKRTMCIYIDVYFLLYMLRLFHGNMYYNFSVLLRYQDYNVNI